MASGGDLHGRFGKFELVLKDPLELDIDVEVAGRCGKNKRGEHIEVANPSDS